MRRRDMPIRRDRSIHHLNRRRDQQITSLPLQPQRSGSVRRRCCPAPDDLAAFQAEQRPGWCAAASVARCRSQMLVSGCRVAVTIAASCGPVGCAT
jgi:hypothetical protein